MGLLGKLKSEGGDGDGDDDDDDDEGENSDFFKIGVVGHVDLTMNYLLVSVNLGFEVK